MLLLIILPVRSDWGGPQSPAPVLPSQQPCNTSLVSLQPCLLCSAIKQPCLPALPASSRHALSREPTRVPWEPQPGFLRWCLHPRPSLRTKTRLFRDRNYCSLNVYCNLWLNTWDTLVNMLYAATPSVLIFFLIYMYFET